MPLAQLGRGARFRVVRVVEQDPAFLRYLTECGLDLGAEGELIENRPEAGILAFRLRDRDAALGLEAAGKIIVDSPGGSKGLEGGSLQSRPPGRCRTGCRPR